MSAIKFTNSDHWATIEAHFAGAKTERFAFAHTRQLTSGNDGPILEVIGVELIDDRDVDHDLSGWSINDAAIDRVHNAAVLGGHGLVEFHNHHDGPPAFSPTDRAGLEPMADYVTGLLTGRLYGATVYAGGRLHVEYWEHIAGAHRHGNVRSVTILAHQLRLLNTPRGTRRDRLNRQAAVLGSDGSDTLGRLRVALVGAGGTGSARGPRPRLPWR